MSKKMNKNRKYRLKKKFKIVLILIFILIIFLFYKLKDKSINISKFNLVEEEVTGPLLDENELIYLALNDTYKLNLNYENIKLTSSDETIAIVSNNIVRPQTEGIVTIIAEYKDIKETIEIDISNLYTKAEIDNTKQLLPCNEYTEEENIYLDKILKSRIDNAGYQTRAGAVAAARFLTLEFKYRIAYFYENGRLLTNGERRYVDGEGRYYHIGLYLSESKFDNIVSSLYGPKIWGCNMYTTTLEILTPNGLDCSGFVSWVLLNAGFDVGDGGAGISESKTNDLDDLGTKIVINKENLAKKEFNVGDLFSRDGHIGILIGMDEEHYYVAEALDYDLHVNTYDDEDLLKSDWYYIIQLDDLYKIDGNLTNMW